MQPAVAIARAHERLMRRVPVAQGELDAFARMQPVGRIAPAEGQLDADDGCIEIAGIPRASSAHGNGQSERRDDLVANQLGKHHNLEPPTTGAKHVGDAGFEPATITL